jgi:hypothetical protein
MAVYAAMFVSSAAVSPVRHRVVKNWRKTELMDGAPSPLKVVVEASLTAPHVGRYLT